jgi:hypothetical protein
MCNKNYCGGMRNGFNDSSECRGDEFKTTDLCEEEF